jgi:hypothetical protein
MAHCARQERAGAPIGLRQYTRGAEGPERASARYGARQQTIRAEIAISGTTDAADQALWQ